MGEQPWRVTVSGAPGLDNMLAMDMLSGDELNGRLGVDLSLPTLLVTYHPVTLEIENTEEQIRELLAALDRWEHNVVFTYPNADPSNRLIIDMIRRAAEGRERFQVKVNLGTKVYFSLMGLAAAMVGNSSSGIIEAASFKLPVVNIGSRQRGRLRGKNVIDVGYDRSEIVAGIDQAVSAGFRSTLSGTVNPYGDGHAAGRIVAVLKSVSLDERLLHKRFYDIEVPVPVTASADRIGSLAP
jgi:UDP-hydrolysing UDP-N-acetyl-D-glucosamine 2-epimerase